MKSWSDLDLARDRKWTAEEIRQEFGETLYATCNRLAGAVQKNPATGLPTLYRWPGPIPRFSSNPPPKASQPVRGQALALTAENPEVFEESENAEPTPPRSETLPIQEAARFAHLDPGAIGQLALDHQIEYRIDSGGGVHVYRDSLERYLSCKKSAFS